MSLRAFHLVFVSVSTLLFVFLAVWAFAFAPEKSTMVSALGYAGVAGVLLMQVYGAYFIRKARRLHL